MLKKLPLAVLAVSGTAFGAIPLVTDDTGTQGSGGNQIELAFTREKAEDGSRAREIALVYTRGLSDTVDAFVEKGRQKNTDAFGTSGSGYGNTVIGAKWRAWESERKTSFAAKATVALPLSATKEAEGFGTGKTSYDATLILAQEMEWGAVMANLGAGREKFRNAAADTDTTHFSVAPVLNLNEQFKVALDLGLDRSKTDTATENSRYAEFGVIYAPSEAIELGLGYIRSKDQDSKEVTKSVTGGVTWRF
jgi:hypothetical protein